MVLLGATLTKIVVVHPFGRILLAAFCTRPKRGQTLLMRRHDQRLQLRASLFGRVLQCRERNLTDVFGTGAGDHREVPELGMGETALGIAAVYRYEESLVFVVDIDEVAAAAETIDVAALSDLVGAAPEGS